MVVVSTRDFRTNQDSKDTVGTPRDLMNELKNALTEVEEAITGKRKLQSADSLMNEL